MVDFNFPVFGDPPDPTDLETFEERVDDYMSKLRGFSVEMNRLCLEFPLAGDHGHAIDDITELQSALDGKAQIADFEARIVAKENQVDTFLANAHPEKRYQQTITIGGSPDYLYPVFWRFPDNGFGIGRLEISRHYSSNGGVGERPLDSTRGHQAALLLAIEGNAYPWSGDSNYLRVVKYHYRYNKTASHLQFGGWCKRRGIDGNPPNYGGDGTNYSYSGIYLRGGGLQYVLSSNWIFAPRRLPDENDPASELIVHTYQTTQFYATRLPFSSLIEPAEG